MRALAPLLLMAAVPAGAMPALAALADWRPGLWQMRAQGGGAAAPMCLAGPDPILTGGGSGCQFTVIENEGDSGVVTWRCPGRSGRTSVRRDAEHLYSVHVQGLEAGRPFGHRAEWRRQGDC
ncbi:MAG: DUF3617 domain-containing protein [Sphingomonadaceae bacterium]